MIVIIAGTYDEAQRHAAIRGYDPGRWVMAQSRKQLRKVAMTAVQLVGSYEAVAGWRVLFDYASDRIGKPAWDVP